MTNFANGSQLTIDRITYVIEQVKTPADHDAAGLHNVAALMRQNDKAADLVLRRPRGARLFFAVVDNAGNVSNVTRI